MRGDRGGRGPGRPGRAGPRRRPRRRRPLVASLSRGDAVVCASDVLALGVHQACVRAGLEPGRDLGIVGFDGSETAAMHHLTSVAQPYEAVAEEVLRLVRAAMRGDDAPASGSLLVPAVRADRSTVPSP
nr:substrate-binding domain-containing protein [Phycicoccus sp. HDW14]